MSSKDNKKHMSAAKDTKGTVKRLLGYLGAGPFYFCNYLHRDFFRNCCIFSVVYSGTDR